SRQFCCPVLARGMCPAFLHLECVVVHLCSNIVPGGPSMQDPRYPIGKFKYPGPSTEPQRKAFVDAIAQTPDNMRAAVNGLSDAQLDAPYRPEGWSVRQV